MKTRFQWIVGGGLVVGVLLWLGAGTIEDSGIFQSLKLGGRTNLVSDDNVDLTYNGAHYQRSVPILNNLTNGNGTNLTSLLASAVQAAQTNETTASITNKLGGFSGATGSYLGADGLFHTVTSGQTNDGTANWIASGTTNSTLPGAASVNSLVSTNGVNTGGLTNTGVTVHTPTAIQSLTAASNVLVNASTMRVNGSGGAVTLTSTPSIQTNNIADGTVITIRGTDDGNTVTLQDYRTLAGTCLSMEVTTVTLKNGSEMRFQWSNGNQRWQSLAFSANSSQNHPFKDATATGWLTASAFDYNAPATLTPTDAGVSIDFGAANRLASITLTGAVTFAFANQTAGRRYELFILGAGANANITWPTVSGVFPAGAYPSVAAAGKWHHLKFTCITSSVTTNIYIDGSTSN